MKQSFLIDNHKNRCYYEEEFGVIKLQKVKEFKTLIKLIKEDKVRIIIASILIVIAGLSSIFTGYLNGAAVESITKLDIKLSLIYLGIYFLISVIMDGYFSNLASAMLQKSENILTRKLSFLLIKRL